jgi:acetyltransferase-like isoleucine patch superfamily enzyme
VRAFEKCSDVDLGKNVVVGKNSEIEGGKMIFGDNVVIGDNCRIRVAERLVIGQDSIIGENTTLRGRDIEIGREFYSNHHAEIGGGSCFESTSKLRIGYWFHQGSYSMVNTAMGVEIGNEVGIGRFTNIYTHGAYQSILNGYPVSFGPISIGNNVWIPSATVNPDVKIGDNVVIGVGSVVTKDLPSGCLAMGAPCKVIKAKVYPRELSVESKRKIVREIFDRWTIEYDEVDKKVPIYRVDSAAFNLSDMSIDGKSSTSTERAKNILRRFGIRFKYEIVESEYSRWAED